MHLAGSKEAGNSHAEGEYNGRESTAIGWGNEGIYSGRRRESGCFAGAGELLSPPFGCELLLVEQGSGGRMGGRAWVLAGMPDLCCQQCMLGSCGVQRSPVLSMPARSCRLLLVVLVVLLFPCDGCCQWELHAMHVGGVTVSM